MTVLERLIGPDIPRAHRLFLLAITAYATDSSNSSTCFSRPG